MLFEPTDSGKVIYDAAMELFDESYDWHSAVRSVGVRCTKLSKKGEGRQLSMFDDSGEKSKKEQTLTKAVDEINKRFGEGTVRSLSELSGIMSPNYDPELYDGGITAGKKSKF